MTGTKTSKGKKFRIVIIVLSIIAFCYLVYMTWHIFGIWHMIASAVISAISFRFLVKRISSRSTRHKFIYYNPKEWPRILCMLILLGIGYYLFRILQASHASKYEYVFGVSYLSLFMVIPSIFLIYVIIRDRNDFIVITDKIIQWRDNMEFAEFNIEDIKDVELYGIEDNDINSASKGGGILLILNNDDAYLIKTFQMNFSGKDVLDAFHDMKNIVQRNIARASAGLES